MRERPRDQAGRAHLPDGDDGIDFDRGAERQHRHADRAAGVAAGLAEYLLHQLGGAVGDLRLVGEMPFEATKAPSLTIRSTRSSDPSACFICAISITAQRSAAAAMLDVIIGAELADDQGPVLAERQLPGNVEQAAGFHRGHISRDRRRGFGSLMPSAARRASMLSVMTDR